MADYDKPTFEHLETAASPMELGDHIAEEDKKLTILQAARAFPRIIPLALVAGCAGMMFGYDNIVNGASISMPAFQLYFGAVTPTHQLYLPSIWASLFTAMSALLQAIGSIAVAPISDRLGRKRSIMAASLISAGGVASQFAATSRGMLLAGKMVNGLAIGASLAVATTWASEVSPVRLRGPVQAGIVLLTVLMQALGLVVIRQNVTIIEQKAFRVVFAIQWAFSALTGILFAMVPESPTWLILRGRLDAAKASTKRIYGCNSQYEARFANLQRQIQTEQRFEHASGIGGYLDLYRNMNLKRTLTVHLLFFGVGLSGASFLAQSILVLITAGLNPVDTFDVSIAGFAIAILTIIGSWIWIEKIGRRSLWLIGCLVNVMVMMIIGALYYAPGSTPLWAAAILMNVLICWQNTTVTSMSWVIAGEISPYRFRSKNQSVSVMSNAITTWLFNFIVPYMYNVDSGNLGIRTGFIFGAASLLLFAVSWPLVPDLRGFTPSEIDWLYQSKISPAKFQQYADGRAAEGAKVAGDSKSDTKVESVRDL